MSWSLVYLLGYVVWALINDLLSLSIAKHLGGYVRGRRVAKLIACCQGSADNTLIKFYLENHCLVKIYRLVVVIERAMSRGVVNRRLPGPQLLRMHRRHSVRLCNSISQFAT